MLVSDCDRVAFNGSDVDRVTFNGQTIWAKPDDTVLYKVGLLSDVHIQTSTTESSKSQADFANALQYLKNAGCAMTCISGDITESGTDAQFAKYVEIRDANRGSMPVYAVTGNHEAGGSRTYGRIITEDGCIAHHINRLIGNHYCYYVKNGQLTYWNISSENHTADTAENVTVMDTSIVLPESDVYIYVGILGDANQAIFWDGLFQWLYNVLDEHKHKRCFIFEHCRAERMVWSSADSAYTNDVYKDYVSGNTGGYYLKPLWNSALSNNHAKEWEKLLSHYTNCIWFHGHTHLVAECNAISDIANVDKHFGNAYNVSNPDASADNTRWSWSVHIPSTAEPRTIGDGGLVVQSAMSQGAIMEVYRNKVIIQYINFAEVSADGSVNYTNQPISTAKYALTTRRDGIGNYSPATSLVKVN